MTLRVAFDLELEHGRCVGIRIPDTAEGLAELERSSLVAAERSFAEGLAPLRRRAWVGGRAALHEALARAGIETTPMPVLSDDRGAPAISAALGSISHKDGLAAALVARSAASRVGLDVEADVEGKQNIASIVLAEDEHRELASLDTPQRAREVLLRFSAKEAIYKALDPYVRRYVGFKEVSVATREDGSAEVRSRLREGEGPFGIDVRWRRWSGIILTTARVSVL